MRIYLGFLILLIAFGSCKSSKISKEEEKKELSTSIVTVKTDSITTNTSPFYFPKENTNIIKDSSNSSNKVFDIVNFAKQFEGIKYKFGGTTKAGMDCSGLVYSTFKAFDITLPRISREMAKEGIKILLEEVQPGDLLFFKTTGKRNIISHVGLVVTALPGNIEFIHSTTHEGVIISSLAERYWYFSFVEARRIL